MVATSLQPLFWLRLSAESLRPCSSTAVAREKSIKHSYETGIRGMPKGSPIMSIVVGFSGSTPKAFHPGALAYAHGLWRRLLNATTSKEVKAVCDESPFWLNPKRGATMFHDLLSGNAKGFLSAIQDRRWPKSDRPTNQGRRIRFLARSMAGITMGISVRTAQDLPVFGCKFCHIIPLESASK
jgi:hypothetical protein